MRTVPGVLSETTIEVGAVAIPRPSRNLVDRLVGVSQQIGCCPHSGFRNQIRERFPASFANDVTCATGADAQALGQLFQGNVAEPMLLVDEAAYDDLAGAGIGSGGVLQPVEVAVPGDNPPNKLAQGFEDMLRFFLTDGFRQLIAGRPDLRMDCAVGIASRQRETRSGHALPSVKHPARAVFADHRHGPFHKPRVADMAATLRGGVGPLQNS